MSAQITAVSNDIVTLFVSGTLTQTELAGAQKQAAGMIDRQGSLKMLVLLVSFEGWEEGANWDDMDFQLSYSDQIERIAIVGETRWEPQALLFCGAGFRSGKVRFFPSEEDLAARAWLTQPA